MSADSFHDAHSTFSPSSSSYFQGDTLSEFDATTGGTGQGQEGVNDGDGGPRYRIGIEASRIELLALYPPTVLSLPKSSEEDGVDADGSFQASCRPPHLRAHLSCSLEGVSVCADLAGSGSGKDAELSSAEPQVRLSFRCSHFHVTEKLPKALDCPHLAGAFNNLPEVALKVVPKPGS